MKYLDPSNFFSPSSSSSPLPFTTIPSPDYTPDNYVYPHQRKKRTNNLVKTNESQMQLAIDASNTSNKQKNNGDRKRKADPSAPKITRPCSECGKKFWSWKALFGHMRCHPERQWRGINPPPNYRRPPTTSPIYPPRDQKDYILGTTMTTTTCITEEEHEVAACLLMLANGDIVGSCDQEEGCRFECSSCKKVFGSHQALGGHRASHKNVKGCFAITRVGDGCENPHDDDRGGGDGGSGGSGVDVKEKLEGIDKTMVLEHKCGICLRVFSSGQALGGHKRCHWEKVDVEGSFSIVKQLEGPNCPLPTVGCCGLDLNLPAPVEDDFLSSYPSNFTNLDLRLGF